MSRKCPVALLVILLACTRDDSVPGSSSTKAADQPAGAVWTLQTAWHLSAEPIVQIQGSNENVEESPLDPVSAFSLPDGRYVVADGDQNGWDALLVYDRKGKFVRSWGREGAGPGEFRQLLNWAGTYRGDSAAAYDFVDRALEIFSPNGTFVRSIKLPNVGPTTRPLRGTYGASDYFVGAFRDGSVLRFERTYMDISTGIGPIYYQPELTLYDAEGQNPLPMGRYRTWGYWWDGQKTAEYHFHPPGITSTGQSYWYYGVADSFTVRVMDRQGKEVRVLRRSLEREAVTAVDREEFIQSYLAMMKASPEGGAAALGPIEKRLRNEARYAEFKPAFSSIVEDAAGNVWIEHFRWVYTNQPNPKPTRWSVFDPQGNFLGEIVMPAGFEISSITGDRVIGIYRDEFDVEHIRVYGLIKP